MSKSVHLTADDRAVVDAATSFMLERAMSEVLQPPSCPCCRDGGLSVVAKIRDFRRRHGFKL